MNNNDIQTEFPVGVINWTNEEGARFPISMVSSGVHAGEIPLEKAHNLQEVGGGTATMKSELERIGYLGSLDASYKAMPIAAHFELHIEQGPILEASGKKIGVVDGVQAFRWHLINVVGRDCHTGTTDLKNRSDAMLTAAKLILHSHNMATELECLASTGILALKPGSINTVPGFVQFSLDIRSRDEDKLLHLEKSLKSNFAKIAAGDAIGRLNSQGTRGRGCTVSWKSDTTSPAIKFHQDCIQCVEDSVEDAIGEKDLALRMTSGAGHDRYVNSQNRLCFPDIVQLLYIKTRTNINDFCAV